MKCREIYREENEATAERYELSMERIHEISTEEIVEGNFGDYFRRTAGFICHIEELLGKIENDWLKTATEEELKAENAFLYADIYRKNMVKAMQIRIMRARNLEVTMVNF